MKVIIVGCGRVGSALAHQLNKKGHLVTVIDQNAAAFNALPNDFHGRLVEGDALVKNVLQRAEIAQADGLVAVTRSDSLNVILAQIARTEYNVSKVIVRNYDPRQRALQETFNFPIVGSASWRVQKIEELLSNDGVLHSVYSDATVGIGVYQLRIPATWEGKTLQTLCTSPAVKLLALTRSDRAMPLTISQTLQTGDVVHLSARLDEIEALRARIEQKEEKK